MNLTGESIISLRAHINKRMKHRVNQVLLTLYKTAASRRTQWHRPQSTYMIISRFTVAFSFIYE